MKISLKNIIARWQQVDSHFVTEAHLPQLIPLDYIEHIYIPKETHESLSENARHTVKRLFRNCITKIDKKGGEYNKFIINELIEKCDRKAQKSISKPVCGAVMTIKATNFEDHYVLPLTISQAFRQYENNHRNISKNCTIYIYWQVMNGDVMLTLSEEQINTKKVQANFKGLICHIAPKPETHESDYHEEITYLNNGHPFQHQTYIGRHQVAAKSKTFYLGCNTDDLLTFCLEINRSNGMVTLSHVGPNSIYNHEQISCKFSKRDLDLNTLEYIHVSAGARTLPIRNLIVCFEKQQDLYVTFDEKFDPAAHISSNTKATGNDDRSTNLLSQGIEYVEGKVKQAINFLRGNGSSKFEPCPDGINCLVQFSDNGSKHNAKYSHPCRFAELCRNPEENLTHHPHQVPNCTSANCDKLIDPIHRSQFRHAGMPYFLIPCRFQDKCQTKTRAHLIKYSHGERVLEPKQAEKSEG